MFIHRRPYLFHKISFFIRAFVDLFPVHYSVFSLVGVKLIHEDSLRIHAYIAFLKFGSRPLYPALIQNVDKRLVSENGPIFTM